MNVNATAQMVTHGQISMKPKTNEQIAKEAFQELVDERYITPWLREGQDSGGIAIILAAIEEARRVDAEFIGKHIRAEQASEGHWEGNQWCPHNPDAPWRKGAAQASEPLQLQEDINLQFPAENISAVQASDVTQKVIDLAYRVICEQSDECKLENLPNEMQCIADSAAQATNYHPKASLDTNPGEGAAKQSGAAPSTLCEVGIGEDDSLTNATADRTSDRSIPRAAQANEEKP